jgi:hypothetical protein
VTISGVRRLYTCESKLLGLNGVYTGLIIKSDIFARNRPEAKASFVQNCRANGIKTAEQDVAVRSADDIAGRYSTSGRT